jgi:hypothetical protein
LFTLFCAGTFAQQTPRDATPNRPTVSKNKSIVTWEKEPDAFMGIKFGESFAAQVPECPKDAVGYHPKAIFSSHRRCFKSIAMYGNKRAFFVENSPDIGFNTINLSPKVVDGNFEGLSFNFFHGDYLKAFELFRARYGEPTSVNTLSYQTIGGASLTGNVNRWQGKNITITVMEYGLRLDEGYVNVSTKKLDESDEADANKNTERNKDKL